jgi:hypothetical protein
MEYPKPPATGGNIKKPEKPKKPKELKEPKKGGFGHAE